MSRSQVLSVLPGDSRDPHSAGVAVGRREAAGTRYLIQPVVKRG